jgi:hypothetical protein
VLIPGSIATSTWFGALQFRVIDILFKDNDMTISAVGVSDTRYKVFMPLVDVALSDPDVRADAAARPSIGGPALEFWALSCLKYDLQYAIRPATTMTGTINVEFCDACPQLAAFFGVESGPSTYRLDSTNPARTTAVWDSFLGKEWDFFLDGRVVIYEIKFTKMQTSYFRRIKATVKTAHASSLERRNYREMVRVHGIKKQGNRFFCNTRDDSA